MPGTAFCRGCFFHGPEWGVGGDMVSCTARILFMHGWGFAHLLGLVLGRPWTGAGPRPGSWGPLHVKQSDDARKPFLGFIYKLLTTGPLCLVFHITIGFSFKVISIDWNSFRLLLSTLIIPQLWF